MLVKNSKVNQFEMYVVHNGTKEAWGLMKTPEAQNKGVVSGGYFIVVEGLSGKFYSIGANHFGNRFGLSSFFCFSKFHPLLKICSLMTESGDNALLYNEIIIPPNKKINKILLGFAHAIVQTEDDMLYSWVRDVITFLDKKKRFFFFL